MSGWVYAHLDPYIGIAADVRVDASINTPSVEINATQLAKIIISFDEPLQVGSFPGNGC